MGYGVGVISDTQISLDINECPKVSVTNKINMLNHPMLLDILEEMPSEKAAICSVSEDQQPCLQMVSCGMPLRCMAMALPA